MIIAFIGHGKYTMNAEEEDRLIELLRSILEQHPDCLFYLGGYGSFDFKCNDILQNLQTEYPKLKRIFVTPYIQPNFWRLNEASKLYDESIYPFEYRVMPKYAIVRRNEWMIKQADIVIAFVCFHFGGAYNSYNYAHNKGKVIINIANNGITD